MSPFKLLFKVFQIIFLALLIMYFNSIVNGEKSVGKGEKSIARSEKSFSKGEKSTMKGAIVKSDRSISKGEKLALRDDRAFGKGDKVPVGVVFDQNTEEIQLAFRFAVAQSNISPLSDLQLFVDVINTADAYKLSRLICNQIGRGMVAMLGAVTPDSFDTLHSYTNAFHLPFVTPWFPEKVIPPTSGLLDFAISIRPDYHRAVIDTIAYYGWTNVIYMYDSHDGLLRLQQLYQSLQPGRATFRISNVKRVTNASNVVDFLRAIERLDRWSTKYVVLDSTTQLAKNALILHVRDVHLGRRNYHYFLSGLVMDDRWEKEVSEFGAINITGFRVLDYNRKMVRDFISTWSKTTVSAQAALMYDATQVLVDAILLGLGKKKPENSKQPDNKSDEKKLNNTCNPKPNCEITTCELGERISRFLKKTELNGLTGFISFNEKGQRKNFTLQVMELTAEGDMKKIGTWYDDKGLIPKVTKSSRQKMSSAYNRNKTYVISTIEEAPYVMKQMDHGGNEALTGFCVDLAELIAERLEIKYSMRVVKDGKYGAENTMVAGGWDGMIGDILRKDADLVIGPLTVTQERETAVDFSKPFLSFDVKRTGNTLGSSIFSFLFPLSKEIWLCIACSVIAVSVVLYLVSRFSPYEWRVVSYTDTQSAENSEVATTKTTVINEFSFCNSLWFCVGSFMQQGSEFAPRSTSGRIVGSVWWFFTFVVLSTYTANLASYLTLVRISEPIPSYDKITACPEDTTGMLTHIDMEQALTDEHGWMAYIKDKSETSHVQGFVEPCEMMISNANSGIKDFAIAMPKGSKLRDGVNMALQAMKNEGVMQMLVRKWFTKTECNINDANIRDTELTLGQVAGLFYVLLGGLALALGVAGMEFCQHGRAEAIRANIPLTTALKAKARLASRAERRTQHRTPQREQERIGWNGGNAFAQYYTPANQIGQEETALNASFTQV